VLCARLLAVTCLSASGALVMPAAAPGGEPPDCSVLLHAMDDFATLCLDYLPVDCITEPQKVNASPNAVNTVSVFVANQSGVHALQTAFELDVSWNLLGGEWCCQTGQSRRRRSRPAAPPGKICVGAGGHPSAGVCHGSGSGDGAYLSFRIGPV
jgi:hypothetical protein